MKSNTTEKKRKRVTYSKEFKDLAVQKVGQVGAKQASDELGVTVQTLNSWTLKAKVDGRPAKAGPSYEELQKENKRLRKELAESYEIGMVLKKSVGIFSREISEFSK